jgi:2'-5' RNA ligase
MPPPGKSQYLIALIPPSPLVEEIQLLKDYFKETYQSKASLKSPPHITLHMPFEWKDTKEEILIAALRKFGAGKICFDLQLQDFSCFAPRVIYLNVLESEPLRTLQSGLHTFCKTELNLFHARYRDLPFYPHITLAFRDLKKEMFENAWAEFKEKKFAGDFVVDKISLLKHDGMVWNPYADFDF